MKRTAKRIFTAVLALTLALLLGTAALAADPAFTFDLTVDGEHTKTVAPHVSPAPNPAKTIFLPSHIIPCLLILSSKIGTLAAEILPHSSRLVGNFSIG